MTGPFRRAAIRSTLQLPSASVLGVAAAANLYRIGNSDGVHALPIVAVRDTNLRRSADYR
jgi:hypothetical protein